MSTERRIVTDIRNARALPTNGMLLFAHEQDPDGDLYLALVWEFFVELADGAFYADGNDLRTKPDLYDNTEEMLQLSELQHAIRSRLNYKYAVDVRFAFANLCLVANSEDGPFAIVLMIDSKAFELDFLLYKPPLATTIGPLAENIEYYQAIVRPNEVGKTHVDLPEDLDRVLRVLIRSKRHGSLYYFDDIAKKEKSLWRLSASLNEYVSQHHTDLLNRE